MVPQLFICLTLVIVHTYTYFLIYIKYEIIESYVSLQNI